MCRFMQEALMLAAKGKYSVAPNPMVGCVLVKGDQIVGRGWHQMVGGPHAEILALQDAGDLAVGATAYITLEPCNHYGRTGPCSAALIASGISHVHIAIIDPNPKVAGTGIARLQAAGITVSVGKCASCVAQAKQLNEVFLHAMIHQQPYITLKWAMSLDGQIAPPLHQTRSITSVAAQQHSHYLRQMADAIVIGHGTALQDNPRLTTRLPENTLNCPAKHPLRIVLTSHNTLPLDLRLFNPQLPGKTVVATTKHMDADWLAQLHARGIESWLLPEDEKQQVLLPALLAELRRRQMLHVLVEGGAKTHASFIQKGLVNAIQVYIAAQLIGATGINPCFSSLTSLALEKRLSLTWQSAEWVGTDLCLQAKVIN